MTFSILHTSSRPGKWREIYQSWIKAAAYPENVQYVLCADERWGFQKIVIDHVDKMVRWPLEGEFGKGRSQDTLCWNEGRRCYVDGVNTAAKAATGDVLVVIADDLWPCADWDLALEEAMGKAAKPEFVIWTNLGTQERERNIMPMPVMSRTRYERLGYVVYPGYESPYSDNDLAEHVQQDAKAGLCSLIEMDAPTFLHDHPAFTGAAMDDQYRAANRDEAYELGRRLFEARRSCGFGEVAAVKLGRKRIGILAAGETFSREWVVAWTELLQLGFQHDLDVRFGYGTNVYATRHAFAEMALEMDPKPDYFLWIDDDNPVSPENVLQLMADMEVHPEADLVAGWTITDGGEISCGRVRKGGKRTPLSQEEFYSGPDFQQIDYTGFPVVLMRREIMEVVGPDAFKPHFEEGSSRFGYVGEDIGFCLALMAEAAPIFVDRRVKVKHMKLRDIAGVKF